MIVVSAMSPQYERQSAEDTVQRPVAKSVDDRFS